MYAQNTRARVESRSAMPSAWPTIIVRRGSGRSAEPIAAANPISTEDLHPPTNCTAGGYLAIFDSGERDALSDLQQARRYDAGQPLPAFLLRAMPNGRPRYLGD